MAQVWEDNEVSTGWQWFENGDSAATKTTSDDLEKSFGRCFAGIDGTNVINHLRQTILDRRLGPSASDAELRFLEGQRSVVAYILSMIERSG